MRFLWLVYLRQRHQPFPSIRIPAPDFTLVLTFMLGASFLLSFTFATFVFGRAAY
jgi:hypothetical protein